MAWAYAAQVLHHRQGVRGVWVQEGEEVPEIPRKGGFKPLPKRWVVERTFAWMGRNRRLGKDYEYHHAGYVVVEDGRVEVCLVQGHA